LLRAQKRVDGERAEGERSEKIASGNHLYVRDALCSQTVPGDSGLPRSRLLAPSKIARSGPTHSLADALPCRRTPLRSRLKDGRASRAGRAPWGAARLAQSFGRIDPRRPASGQITGHHPDRQE
jgi:hypothetical protein